MTRAKQKQQGDTAEKSLMKNSLPDEELMFQVRNGVAEMLAVLFDRYQSPLFSFYCKLTGDRAASEDLVQDVFYRILKYRHTYRPGTSFRTWMYHIARNARLDLLKRQRPEVEIGTEVFSPKVAEDALEKNQEVEMLHRALMRLPEEKREVLLLSRFQDLKYEEIARIQGCEVGAVKVRVHRALNELRDLFHQLESEHSRPKVVDRNVGS